MADRIEQFILRMVEQSTPEKTAWNMEKIREGRPVRWNYIDGCMLTALNVLSDITGNGCYAAFADPATGLYWQVVDQGTRAGNYLESSGSSMIACGMLKGARLGVLDEAFRSLGQKTFTALSDRLVWRDGEPELGGICLVAGLGPENNRRRDGSYEYYLSEPVVANDAKGVAPFVLCYTEMLRAGLLN